ncbi:hypothetical protein GMOD_00001970 [Pyrenophora seminiperda CCB06]|uniref:Uncharacterized protein n=1 Tax=Pyrenophora seminiperda CCB06 TaxID=1302712 RepID=A0A3M7LWJ8_9PLEO|nr:hypothetical protein GMOD_00001970 [Pyrenophora seminiperda CCB06]
MRFSIASVAILAGAVAAVPQYGVQPISQISDGQIQAPPASTAVVPGGPEVPATTPAASVPAMSTGSVATSEGKLTPYTPLLVAWC